MGMRRIKKMTKTITNFSYFASYPCSLQLFKGKQQINMEKSAKNFSHTLN